MKQARVWATLLAVVIAGAGVVRADSTPVISGNVQTIELCPQSLCGVAVFVGFFQGRIGANAHAFATIGVAVNHDPLPAPGACAAVTGGVWQLQTLTRSISGITAGQLCGVTALKFGVNVGMLITSGGSGTLGFSGLLNHTPFPPTLDGTISQTP